MLATQINETTFFIFMNLYITKYIHRPPLSTMSRGTLLRRRHTEVQNTPITACVELIRSFTAFGCRAHDFLLGSSKALAPVSIFLHHHWTRIAVHLGRTWSEPHLYNPFMMSFSAFVDITLCQLLHKLAKLASYFHGLVYLHLCTVECGRRLETPQATHL